MNNKHKIVFSFQIHNHQEDTNTDQIDQQTNIYDVSLALKSQLEPCGLDWIMESAHRLWTNNTAIPEIHTGNLHAKWNNLASCNNITKKNTLPSNL